MLHLSAEKKMIIVIPHNIALEITTFSVICDVYRNEYYFYASRRDLMLEQGYVSSLYARFRLLIVAFKTMDRGLCCGNV